MATRYLTLNSSYEVAGTRIRRTSGLNPTVLPVADGDWIEAVEITEVPMGGENVVVYARFEDGTYFRSSLIVQKDEGVEPVSSLPCASCSGVACEDRR